MTVQRPQGTNGTLQIETLLRQVLAEGLVALVADDYRLNELYERVDSLLQSSGADWTADLSARLRQLTAMVAPPALSLRVGYPTLPAHLPCLTIILESGAEQPGAAAMGDLIARRVELVGTPAADDWSAHEAVRYDVIGTDFGTSIQIGSWALAPEEALLLHEAVRNVLLHDKGRLHAVGAYNVSMTEGGGQPSQELAPHVGYVPMHRISLDWTLRTTRRARARTRFRVSITLGN